MSEIDIAIDEFRVKGVICPKCGGYGGGTWNGNEHGPLQNYMPCYQCGDSGCISYADWMEELERHEIKLSHQLPTILLLIWMTMIITIPVTFKSCSESISFFLFLSAFCFFCKSRY